MIRVIIETPYANTVTDVVRQHIRYLRACLRDSLLRNEAPFASHAMYTQPGVLSDDVEADRGLGITAGLKWRGCAEKTVVYTDLGISPGMQGGIDLAEHLGQPVEYRQLGENWSEAATVNEVDAPGRGWR
jgi:hypothetical protein